jgi:hypothetical protein
MKSLTTGSQDHFFGLGPPTGSTVSSCWRSEVVLNFIPAYGPAVGSPTTEG